MAKLVKHKKDNYTVIDNGVFKNRNLSLKAKGLLCLMLSLPDNWDWSVKGLSTLSKDGVSAVRTALDELGKAGYFKRQYIRKNGKIADVEYVVSDFLISENLTLENLMLEKQPQLNTKQSNTKEINKIKNDEAVVLSQRLSDKDWEKLDSRYENIVDLIDMIDNQVIDLETIKKPYNYICAIADKQNWERKMP